MTNATRSSEATFEQLEKRLHEALARLEDPDAPLEERVRQHREAVRLHARMDAVLAEARDLVKPAEAKTGTPPDAADEPYEKVLARLTAAVEELEREDLPLARALQLHREAEALADRCESILKSAQGTLEELTPGAISNTPAPPDDIPPDLPAAPVPFPGDNDASPF